MNSNEIDWKGEESDSGPRERIEAKILRSSLWQHRTKTFSEFSADGWWSENQSRLFFFPSTKWGIEWVYCLSRIFELLLESHKKLFFLRRRMFRWCNVEKCFSLGLFTWNFSKQRRRDVLMGKSSRRLITVSSMRLGWCEFEFIELSKLHQLRLARGARLNRINMRTLWASDCFASSTATDRPEK